MRPWILPLVALAALAFRCWPTPAPYLELDSALYLRAAAEYHQAFADGSWLRNPLTEEHYTAIEYWPPLFPVLAGLLGPWVVAVGAGWLTLFPMYHLARRLWDERTALLTAGLVGLNPFLAWYARVPRSESLFMLLDALCLALVLPPNSRPLLGGVFLGLAYATRFDALLLLPATLIAAGILRGRRVALLTLVGFALGALPYLAFLAHLNGGVPTLISPQKALYDTLEGVWTRSQGRGMFEFTTHFGPPGMIRVDPDDPLVRELLATQVHGLVLEGVRKIPESLLSASWNWAPLLLAPVLLALRSARDRRLQAMLWLLLPVPAYAVLTSWDPNPRYYAFTLLPLSVLAARGLRALDDSPPAANVRWALLALLAPLGLAVGWVVPGPAHFDGRAPVEALFHDLLPDARHLGIGLVGFGLAALLARGRQRLGAGLVGVAAAWAVAGPTLVPALGTGLYRHAVPLSLALLALAPLPLFATLPRDLWGPRMRRWLLVAMAVLAVQNAVWLALWDLALTRITHSPEMAETLQRVARGRRVIAFHQIDALRAGTEWVPVRGGVLATLDQQPADFLLLSSPEGSGGNFSSVPQVERTGRVTLEAEHPAPGDVPGHPRVWRLYRISGRAGE